MKGAVQIRLAALSTTASNLIQRKCAWGAKSEASEYDECFNAWHVLRMSDAPFGRGFAHDFSQVPVHWNETRPAWQVNRKRQDALVAAHAHRTNRPAVTKS